MLTSTVFLHSVIFLTLSHFYFPVNLIYSFISYLQIVFGQNIYICTVLPNLGRFLTIPPIIVVIIVIVIFFYYYLSLQSHLQETTYLPGFRWSGITTLLSEIIKLLMMRIRIRRRRRKRSRRRRGGRRRRRHESPDRSVRTPTRNLFARHSPASSEEIRFPIIFTLTSFSSGSDLVLFL